MYEPKSRPVERSPWRLVYVGVVNELKGVGDAIEAVAALQRRGRDVELQLIGKGDVDLFSRRVALRAWRTACILKVYSPIAASSKR